MNPETPNQTEERDRPLLDDNVLARVKSVARRIVERVRRVTEDEPGRQIGPDDPTDELPAFG
jgi:hypothetical protein